MVPVRRRIPPLVVAVATIAALLTGCAVAASAPSTTNSPSNAIARPPSGSGTTTPHLSNPLTVAPHGYRALPTGRVVDYQLGGGYPPAAGVGIVTRDSTERAVPGVYSICYVNGFQTQPQDAAWWKKNHLDLVVRDAHGRPIVDANWPDEMILDVSTVAKRSKLVGILGTSIALCQAHGFAAVEFDNLDSWTRSAGHLTRAENLAFATLLVSAGHAHALAVGQKNTLELGTLGRDTAHFDFVVAEECDAYDECAGYTAVYGARVIDIEYPDDLRRAFATVCADPKTPPMTILRDRDLVTPADRNYVYQHC